MLIFSMSTSLTLMRVSRKKHPNHQAKNNQIGMPSSFSGNKTYLPFGKIFNASCQQRWIHRAFAQT
ncbi:hypothetical protein CPter91_2710 [Collimonas pratensis]|uniref:Uncharacterized protein n=1 Tax=Collimonas pratensis TaxID=279113 RepID=A0A127Q4Q3_9BURK|nr:hypothetical protein CPter91_2710 [Collimonas pratensis]